MPSKTDGVPGKPYRMLCITECHLLAPFPLTYTNMSALQNRDDLMVILNSCTSKNVCKAVRLCSAVFFFISSLDLLAYLFCRKCYNQIPNMHDKSIIK